MEVKMQLNNNLTYEEMVTVIADNYRRTRSEHLAHNLSDAEIQERAESQAEEIMHRRLIASLRSYYKQIRSN
jgi:hypothetical protein